MPGQFNPANSVILALHLIVIALGLGGAWILEIPLSHLGFGFLFGVALYSMYWRHIYGFWPEREN